jgi:hypothetical protein
MSTGFAVWPSAANTMFTRPLPASEVGSGPMLTWSNPAQEPCGPE